MVRRAQAILAPAHGFGAINCICFQGRKRCTGGIGWDDLKCRAAAMQDQERGAGPCPLDDSRQATAQFLGINRFESGFHVQLKMNPALLQARSFSAAGR